MGLLVADIRRQLDSEWALLGPAASTMSSFLLDWGGDGKLRLPRMEDSLFGVSVRFPSVETEEEQHDDDDDDGSSSEAGASEVEQVASLDSERDETNGRSSTDKTTVIAPLESSLGGAFENRPPADADQAVGAQASQGTSEMAIPADGISSDTSRPDAHMSAAEIRGTTPQAETSAKQQPERLTENMDGARLQPGRDGNSQLASVQEILATHSRDEILLELEWARQALCDRRKYLRSKRRVERGPNPCACT